MVQKHEFLDLLELTIRSRRSSTYGCVNEQVYDSNYIILPCILEDTVMSRVSIYLW